ncbi:MAG: 2-oxo acid dehydrogenase subunit E2 [Sedimentisphaerales bacterium]|nr:2-oxo acid dehydrogenase subunit E2 [Sedimentisphaerales bacterium]
MAKEVRLPQLGQTMVEGTVVNCSISVGDEVKKGDIIFEIETDKATLELESPDEGFVKNILVSIEQSIRVGEPLLVLGQKDETVPQSYIDSLTEKIQRGEPSGMGVIPIEIKIENSSDNITGQNIKDALANNSSSQSTVSLDQVGLGQRFPVNRLQKLTAQRMLKSKREIPCFYLTVKTDVTGLVELRDRLNDNNDVKYSYNDFIIKAIATGLEKFPIMTGQIDGDMIKVQESINVGLAISVPGGLVVPVLKDVNNKDIKQISSDSVTLIDKARSNKLALTDLEGACITISNLGAFGVDNFIPIVVPGQCCILGVGKINNICVPDNGIMVIRKQMNITLSVDHKIVNGAYAAQFMDFVHKLLEDASSFDIDK